MSLRDLLEAQGRKAYIVEIGAGCPIAHEIFKCSGASKVVYHTESPYGSAKAIYGDVIGNDRMVSLRAVHQIAIKLAETHNCNYNMVIVTSFQIKSGADDDRIPHGWVCFGVQQEDKTWRFTVAHLTFMNQLGYSLDREDTIECIYNEVYRLIAGEGHYHFVDEYYNSTPNNFHVLTSYAPVFYKNNILIRLEDYSRRYKRIAIYKGSFNPIHFGHLAIAKKIRDENPDTLVIFAISKDTHGKGEVDYDNLVTRMKAICEEDFIVVLLKNGYFFDGFQYLKNRTKLPIDLIMGVDTYNRLVNCYKTCDFSPNEEQEINEFVDDSNMARHYDSFFDVVTRNKAKIFNKMFEDATFRVFGRQQPLDTCIKPKNLEYYHDFDCQISSSEIRQLQESGESEKANNLKNGELKMINGMNMWKMLGMSIAVATDSYKASHAKQYPKKTRKVISYMEARGSTIADYVLWYGIYYKLKAYLQGVVITKTDVDKAEKFWDAHFGYKVFDRKYWDYIVENCGGKLPIRIRAVKEGTKVKNHNVLMVVENTDDNCWWLTNFVEALLMKVWYPCTVATNSAEIRKTILQYLEETGTPEDIWFKCHDFGYRGVSSEETAAIGSSAHLLSFMGTDTVSGIFFAQEVYNTEAMIGYSVPASEHSTITSWGREGEIEAFENMLDTYPEGIVACVSDSFHILEAMDKWGTLKHKIETRKGRLVVRPDSGDPARTDLAVIEKLGTIFGCSINAKGYKVLPDYIRVIQGDGVSRKSIAHILETLKNAGWSADNIGFGSGGKLLQDFNRDDFNFAIKCCEVDVDGEIRYIEKTPVEINEKGELVFSFKTSKKGNMKLVKDGDNFRTVTALDPEYPDAVDEMEVIFDNGEILVHPKYDDIRARAVD